jgi:hypothetical protein
MDFHNLSVRQIEEALHIRRTIEKLQSRLSQIIGRDKAGRSAKTASTSRPRRRRRKMSPEARAKIAEAQRRRWARQKAGSRK